MNEDERYLKKLLKAWGIECNEYAFHYLCCNTDIIPSVRNFRRCLLDARDRAKEFETRGGVEIDKFIGEKLALGYTVGDIEEMHKTGTMYGILVENLKDIKEDSDGNTD